MSIDYGRLYNLPEVEKEAEREPLLEVKEEPKPELNENEIFVAEPKPKKKKTQSSLALHSPSELDQIKVDTSPIKMTKKEVEATVGTNKRTKKEHMEYMRKRSMEERAKKKAQKEKKTASPPSQRARYPAPASNPFDYDEIANRVVQRLKPQKSPEQERYEKLKMLEQKIREDERERIRKEKLETEEKRRREIRNKDHAYYSKFAPPTGSLSNSNYWDNFFKIN